MVKRILFVCTKNRLRSPTAEQVFANYDGIETASAGTSADADIRLSADIVAWADIIFVMEKQHRTKVQQKFQAQLKAAKIVCLDIPDNYAYMDPALVKLLERKVKPHLR